MENNTYNFRLEPLKQTNPQVQFILTAYRLRLTTKAKAQKALNRLRDKQMIKDNMYQGVNYN